jgi:NAD(P)-dependent dehydrogenase (short-subunit alcohol dehydrogenase family)
MARVFITGSSDGLGYLAAKLLMDQGHQVVVHGRNQQRAHDIQKRMPNTEAVLIGDLANIEETKNLAHKANKSGAFDAVIHNAGIYRGSGSQLFTVNVLAPYMLTCLMHKPQRLIYLCSRMHLQGQFKPTNNNTAIDKTTYSDSKLYLMMLCKAVSTKWPDVYANAVDPGWVPTKMGGAGAPDDLQKGYETQAWLAVSNDERTKTTGRYFFHQKEEKYNAIANDVSLQQQLFKVCEELTGVQFPQ